MKYNFAEEDLLESMCQMDPIYSRRTTHMDVIFRSGDYRSTLDDREMAKASRSREAAMEVNHTLLDSAHRPLSSSFLWFIFRTL